MAIGKTDPGTTVVYQGKPVRVSPEGFFVIGFSRDAGPAAEIELQRPSGTVEKHPVSIENAPIKSSVSMDCRRAKSALLPKIWNASAKRLPW
jgi:hypothetical protein